MLLLKQRAVLLTAHYKRFKFPKLRVPLPKINLLCLQVYSDCVHIIQWERGPRELVQNSDAWATGIAVSNASPFVSAPGSLCVPPEPVKL